MDPEGQLATATADTRVWRIGFRTEPDAWSGWEWATDGRFPGRWDDLHGNFRTVYAGSSLRACLLEVLASFRRDARLAMELDEIVEDDEDAVLHPTLASGQVPPGWLDARAAASAELTGTYCAVTDSRSIAVLHPHFIGVALSLGFLDLGRRSLERRPATPTDPGNRRLDLRDNRARRGYLRIAPWRRPAALGNLRTTRRPLRYPEANARQARGTAPRQRCDQRRLPDARPDVEE